MQFNAVYTIPNNVEYIFVSDFFSEDITGGAELTTQAIMDACPSSTFKLRSSQVTEHLIEANKDKKWILCNYTGVSKDNLVRIANSCNYSIIEYDYKYCIYRSSHLHKLQTGNECDCHQQVVGKFISGLMKRAKSVHFMSQGQMNEYIRLFPKMKTWSHLFVQGSTFDSKTLDNLKALRLKNNNKDPRAVVLEGGSWIKNKQQTELYCQFNKIPYVLLGGLPPEDFLKELAKYSKLVFHTAGYDTCPRLTIEAALLGLKLDLNDNVQNKNDEWFQLPVNELNAYLRILPEKFWKEVKL